MLKTKVYLCSFASNDLNSSVKRFIKQAHQMDFYDDIKVYKPQDFSKKLRIRIRNLFKVGGKNRYYGYDVWRPEIINDFLNKIPENSILHYSDIGSHINYRGKWRLKDYVENTQKNEMSVFEYGEPPKEIFRKEYKYQKYFEYEHTKCDVINYFGLNKESVIFNSPQIWGGTFFLKKSKFSTKFMNEWEKANIHTNLFDDSTSTAENHLKFKGMRGCQSVFSILSKLNNSYKFSASECEWAEHNNLRVWDHIYNYPILAKRDKQFNIFKKFINRQIKTINRLKSKLK